jgi:hypothetical protein
VTAIAISPFAFYGIGDGSCFVPVVPARIAVYPFAVSETDLFHSWFNALLGVMPEPAAEARTGRGSPPELDEPRQLSETERFALQYPMLGSDNIFVSSAFGTWLF